jgi:hypothetical protein
MTTHGLKGENGAVLLSASGTSLTSQMCDAIQIIEDCTFSALTSTNWSGTAATAVTYPAGIVIYGRFTSIAVSAGSCLAYKAS